MKKNLHLFAVGLVSLLLSLALSPIRIWSFIYSEITMYVVYALFTACCLLRLRSVSSWVVLLSIFIGWACLNVPLRFMPGTAGSIPNFIMDMLGILAGYAFYLTTIHRYKIGRVTVVAASILLLTAIGPLHNRWLHYANYVNFSGTIRAERIEPFRATRFSSGQPDVLIGENPEKYYIINFWYSGCGACHHCFPEFDKLYESNKENDRLLFYAISPLDGADYMPPTGFGFPFLRCDRSVVPFLTCFPSFIVIKNREIIFRGHINPLNSFIHQISNQ